MGEEGGVWVKEEKWAGGEERGVEGRGEGEKDWREGGRGRGEKGGGVREG